MSGQSIVWSVNRQISQSCSFEISFHQCCDQRWWLMLAIPFLPEISQWLRVGGLIFIKKKRTPAVTRPGCCNTHCTAEKLCVLVDLSSDCTENCGASVIFSGNFPAFTCFLNHILSCKPWGMINRTIFSLEGAKEALSAIIMYSNPTYLPTVQCIHKVIQ